MFSIIFHTLINKQNLEKTILLRTTKIYGRNRGSLSIRATSLSHQFTYVLCDLGQLLAQTNAKINCLTGSSYLCLPSPLIFNLRMSLDECLFSTTTFTSDTTLN